jgi:parallel beta-helix repeat protein
MDQVGPLSRRDGATSVAPIGDPKGLAVIKASLRRLHVLGIAASATALLSVSPAIPATGSEFVAEADSYTTALHPNENRGESSELKADADPARTIYLRFNVSGIDTASTVALKVWVERRNRHGLQVHSVSEPWDEQEITLENAPAIGPVAAATGAISAGEWAIADVTALVRANGNVSLALTTASESSISVASREADPSQSPRLVVTNPAPEPPPLSPFTVTRDGSAYRADSPRGAAFSGSLKSVVESAAWELSRNGGGAVRFGAGTFDLGLDALRFEGLSGVTFEGAGMDVTEIRNSTNLAADTEIFSFLRGDQIVIRDLTVVARGEQRPTSDAIDLDAVSNSLVERVRVGASRGRGIVVDGKDVAADGTPLAARNNVIRDCVVGAVPADGIQLLAAANNRVERCTITGAGRHGISIIKASAQAGQANKQSVENVVSGNLIQSAGDDGISLISGNQNQLLANIVQNSSTLTQSSDGIKLSAADSTPCNDNIVTGNEASDTRTAKLQRYGLNISSALCARTIVGANVFSGNRVGPIQNFGTDTIFSAPTDTEPPSVPGDVFATAADAKRVDIIWSEATDSVAVAGYTIYRDGAPIATAPASARTYADTSVAGATTYSYTVDAFDEVGNHSAESAAASVTTPPGATVSTFAAVADTYVTAAAPTTPHGSAAELRTDVDPATRSFVRFDVSGIAGVPSRVTLRIYANTNSSAGYEVRPVTGAWDEQLTLDGAPAAGDPVGASGAFVGGAYTELDVTSAVTGNGVFDFALVGLSATAVSYASRETSTPPKLVVEHSG